MTDSEVIDFVEKLPETCEIDLFSRTRAHDNIYGATLEIIAQATGVTRERVRQVEAKAIQKMRLNHRLSLLRDFRQDQYGTEKDPYYTNYPDAFWIDKAARLLEEAKAEAEQTIRYFRETWLD